MNITPEEKKDIDTRIEEFLRRHKTNVEELMVDFSMLPIPVQIFQGIYATSIRAMPMDLKYLEKPSTPSPFQDNVIK